jgi:hypothetical protein
MNTFTIEVSVYENEDGHWTASDNLSEQEGVADTLLGSVEEWYYGFVYAVRENIIPPKAKEFRTFVDIFLKEEDLR